MRIKHTLPMALVAVVLTVSGAQAGVMTETVTSSVMLNVDFGMTYDADIFLDRFDTQGGTRELVGIDFTYNRLITATIFWDANPLSDQPVGTDIGVSTSWDGMVDGIAIPYRVTGGSGHNVASTTYWGIDLNPGDGAGFADDAAGSGTNFDIGMNPIDDAALFAAFTGTGQAHLDGVLDISEMFERQILGPLHDLIFPDHVFIPGLMYGELGDYSLEISVDYHYVTVPAPGAASVFAFGALTVGARRRRR